MPTVQELINDIDERLPNSFSNSFKVNAMNEVMRKIFKYMNEKEMYQFTTITDQATYVLANDIVLDEILTVEMSNDVTVTTDTIFTEYTYKGLNETLTGNNYYDAINGLIGLYPAPDTTGYTVNIIYEKRPTLLSTDNLSATPEINEDYHDLLKFYALSVVAKSGHNPDVQLANNYLSDYNDIWFLMRKDFDEKKMKNRLKQNKIGGGKMLRAWRPVDFKTNQILSNMGDGINTFYPPFDVADSEATYLRNVSSRSYPALSVRPGRKGFASALTTPNGLGQRANQYLHVVDGTTWKYWNGTSYSNVATGLADAGAEFEDFATGSSRFTIMSNGTERKSWDGTTVTNLTAAPNAKIFASHLQRLFWARDNDVVYSAGGDITDYTSPNDAGAFDVTNAKGNITSIIPFDSKLVMFSEYSMHRLYGSEPTNFQVVDIEGNIGCISDKSTVICNKRLYWVWYDGVYEDSGSGPIKVSEPYFIGGNNVNGVTGGVTEYIKNMNLSLKDKIVSGSYGDYLYIAIPYGSTATNNNLLLVFDTKLRKWYVETGAFVDFVTFANYLYGVDTTGKLWDMVSGTDDDGSSISWEYITKVFTDGAISQKKVVSNLWVTADLPTGSTLNVYTSQSVDNDDFELLYTFTANANEQNTRIVLPVTKLQNIDWYRLKFLGTGQCKIHFVEKIIRIKTR